MRQHLRSCGGGELCFHLSSQNIATYYSDTVVASAAAAVVDDGSLFAAIATRARDFRESIQGFRENNENV